MRIYKLPETTEIAYFVACSIESAQQIFFYPGNWWKDYYYIACFDEQGNWFTEYQVCVDYETGEYYLETEY